MITMKSSSGFTLVELLMVVGLIGIVSAIAVPALMGEMPTYRLNGAARQVMSDLLAARMQAVSQNNRFMVSFDADNHRYTMLDDDDNDGNADVGETAIVNDLHAEYSGINFTSTLNLTFMPDGTVSNSGSITISNSCDPPLDVVVTGAGRVRIEP